MPRLQVIVGSTRPGRIGPVVADWFVERALADGRFEIELVDLAVVGLPLLDEPALPRSGAYLHPHTVAWSRLIASGDAYVIVTPEYNGGFPGSLKNAIDYLHAEWRLKPVGFVSYGGVAAGTRAVQMLKQVLTTLDMTPVWAAVAIPFVDRLVDQDGVLHPTPEMVRGATGMLDALAERLVPIARPMPADR